MEHTSLENIVKLAQHNDIEKINSYLDIGWKLVGTSSTQYSENGYTLSYVVGWSNSQGEIQYPEKTKIEVDLESWSDDLGL